MRRVIAVVLGTLLLAVASPAGSAQPRPAPDDRLQWQLGDLPADLTVDAEGSDRDD